MEEGRYINPYTDFGFKKLFGTEMNKDLLVSFLNSLFNNLESEIEDVQRNWATATATAARYSTCIA